MSRVVAGSEDNNIYLFSSEGKLLWKYETGKSVYSVAITPDGSRVVAGTKYNNIYLFANLKGLISIAILKMQEKLQEAKKLEVDVSSAEELLNQAQNYFESGEYTKAEELAKQSAEIADKIIKESIPKVTIDLLDLPAFNTWGNWKVEVKNNGVTS